MTSDPLGIRLAAIEVVQREGASLAPFDQGVLTAARRTGDAELVARVDAIRRVDEVRSQKRAHSKARRGLSSEELD